MSHLTVYIYDEHDFKYLKTRGGSLETVLDTIEYNNEKYTLTPPPDTENTWKWVDTEWVVVKNIDVPVKILQENVWTKIKDKRLEQVTSGVLVTSVDKLFHTDETSAIQYSNVAGMIALNNYDPVQWKVMDNTWVLLTKELFIELQKAMNANTQATYAIAEQHKEAMMLLDDPSNYDFSTGWTNGVIDYN